MTDVRYKAWVSKTGRKGACLLPKLKAIPPTLDAFKENIKRAHFQACIWKAALDEESPNLDPLKFGWVKDDLAKSLCAVPLPQDSSCTSRITQNDSVHVQQYQPSLSLKCGCVSGQLPRSLFCKCGKSNSCCNQMTKNNMAMLLMMVRSIVMMKMMEMRMRISYAMDSNALLFTSNILIGQLM